MCKLIIVVKKEGKNASAERCVRGQYGALLAERHGFSSLAMISGKATRFSALDPKAYADAYLKTLDALDGATLAVVHARTATSGTVAERNLHMARDDRGRVLAHNGIVYKFSTWGATTKQNALPLTAKDVNDASPETVRGWSINKAKKAIRRVKWMIDKCFACNGVDLPCEKHIDEAIMYDWMSEFIEKRRTGAEEAKPEKKPATPPDETDSQRFLQALPDVLNKEVLEDAIKKHEFTGVACILDTNTGDSWLLATRDVYVHTDGAFMALYSYRPDEPRSRETLAGLPVEFNDENVVCGRVEEGVYQIGAME